MNHFITMSLETHLFFARIMKEHSLFLQTGFQLPGNAYRNRADRHRRNWEHFLRRIVRLSNGILGEDVLCSGEVVTEYTRQAEMGTSKLTGVPIDVSITEATQRLQTGCFERENPQMIRMVRMLNEEALQMLCGLIDLKQDILNHVDGCCLFTANYPLLIEHILREAKLYHSIIRELNEHGEMSSCCRRETEQFWNQIMMEHALFIRGLLDPSEEELIKTAHEFAMDYRCLLEEARNQDCKTMDDLTRRTIEKTMEYRDFKAAGTDGITNCEISSLILPLLADHVLREANHYLRILMPECEG